MPGGNVELIQRGFGLFADGGLEALLPFVDPDVEVFAAAAVLNSGRYSGHDGLTRWSERWFDAWQDISYEPLEFIEVSESVIVVPVVQRAKGASSGIEVEQEIVWTFEVRDDRITRLHLYADREAALEAAEEMRRAVKAAARE